MEMMVAEQGAEDIHPLGAVVVAGDQHDFHLGQALRKLSDEIIEEGHCLCRGDRFIVDIPGDNQGIGLPLFGHCYDLLENVFLVFAEVMIHELQAYMQV